MTVREPGDHDDRRGPLSHLIGLAVYLGVLGVLSLLANAYPASNWAGLVAFLIATVWVVVALTVANLLSDLVLGLPFPVNLPGVPIRALAAAGSAWYVVQLLLEVDRLFGLGLFVPLAPLAPLLYAAVFVLVLVGETIRLFTPRTRAG